MFRSPRRLWRGALVAATAALVACGGVACTQQDNTATDESTTQSAQQGEWPRTITTDDGDLTLNAQPKRIVSTSVTLTGSLLAVNAPVVATGTTLPNLPEASDDVGFFEQWADKAKEKGVEKLWEIRSPEIEKVVDYNPDLILVAKTSGDSVFDQVQELRKIAPVLVIDYSGASWQDVTRTIGKATGHEADAEKAIDDFNNRVTQVKETITLPEGTVSPFMVARNFEGAAALTDKAPQSQLLEQLGFRLAPVPDEVKGKTTLGKRSDIIELSNENIQKGLTGDVWIGVGMGDIGKKQMESNPAFTRSKQFKEGKIYITPKDTFRFDYYSANIFLDSIVKQFKK